MLEVEGDFHQWSEVRRGWRAPRRTSCISRARPPAALSAPRTVCGCRAAGRTCAAALGVRLHGRERAPAMAVPVRHPDLAVEAVESLGVDALAIDRAVESRRGALVEGGGIRSCRRLSPRCRCLDPHVDNVSFPHSSIPACGGPALGSDDLTRLSGRGGGFARRPCEPRTAG